MIENVTAKSSANDIKKLSLHAEEFITELYGKQGHFLVEEARRSENNKDWILTVSYFSKHESPNDLQKFLGLLGSRVYKQMTIEPDGKVVAVANWYPEQTAAV